MAHRIIRPPAHREILKILFILASFFSRLRTQSRGLILLVRRNKEFSMIARFICLLAVLSLPVLPARPGEREAKPFTASQFAAIIERISEEGGYFWNDNFVSNEASYLHPLRKLKELGIEGGVYLGVGPNQNFTYIAKIRPRYAFIIDVRRQNLLEHLFFKALFHFSRDRSEYLSMLLSRHIRNAAALGESCTIEDIVQHLKNTDPDPRLYRRNRGRVRLFLKEACRVKLSEQDFATIDKIQGAFYLRGLSIKYDYIPVPTYGEFLRERDLEGNQQNFLNSSRDFRYLKQLHEENRIIPVVGDFAGPHALRDIGKFLKERDEKVLVFYTSNVEQYLMRSNSWKQFLDNVRELPLDDHAVFIRAYWSNRVPHPEGIAGYRFTQILQWAKSFLKTFGDNRSYTYWDIITTDTIKLH